MWCEDVNDLAIRVEGLGKRYVVGGAAPYLSLRDSLAAVPRRLFHRSSGGRRQEVVWALKDLSFELKQGEVLGIIGRNGAGKSTLLKILSRITRPTEGRAEVWGRVGSLLEVGTGFHPELTGRENIWLYGAILGLKRHEIQKIFDEIVAFSEVESFLDTPIKHYSSGMQMRLAFSVAAHLEPEVLLVDEVLAVGDAAFQRKSLGKMEDVQKGGRTVLFVSHNMAAIRTLCRTVMWLSQGGIRQTGPATPVVSAYLNEASSLVPIEASGLKVSVEFFDKYLRPADEWVTSEDLAVRVRLDSAFDLQRPVLDLSFFTDEGIRVFSISGSSFPDAIPQLAKRKLVVEYRIGPVPLLCDSLLVDVGVRIDNPGAPHYVLHERGCRRLALVPGLASARGHVADLLGVAVSSKIVEVN